MAAEFLPELSYTRLVSNTMSNHNRFNIQHWSYITPNSTDFLVLRIRTNCGIYKLDKLDQLLLDILSVTNRVYMRDHAATQSPLLRRIAVQLYLLFQKSMKDVNNLWNAWNHDYTKQTCRHIFIENKCSGTYYLTSTLSNLATISDYLSVVFSLITIWSYYQYH